MVIVEGYIMGMIKEKGWVEALYYVQLKAVLLNIDKSKAYKSKKYSRAFTK